jgi:hypothetical protein
MMHPDQVHFQAESRGPGGLNKQQAFFHPALQIHSDGAHIPDDLFGRFLEGEQDGFFAAPAGGVDEVRSHTGFAGSGRSGYQHAAAAKIAAAFEHRVQIGHAGRDPTGRGGMGQPQRGHRKNGDAVLVDEERIFIGAVGGSAVLEHAQAAGYSVVLHAMVEENHAIGDVFFEAVAGQRALAALSGDDGGDSLILEPAEQAPQFGAEYAGVGKAREERFGSVEENALGFDRIDRRVQADEQAFQIVLAGLRDFVFVDIDVIDDQLPGFLKLFEIEAERGDVQR